MHRCHRGSAAPAALPGDDDHPAWARAGRLAVDQRRVPSTRPVAWRARFPAVGSGGGAPLRALRKAEFTRWLLRRCRRAWTRSSRCTGSARCRRPATRTMRGNSSSRRCASRRRRRCAGPACLPRAANPISPRRRCWALSALGAADDPSDLLLAVDYRLAHLLVDEFQDTSRASTRADRTPHAKAGKQAMGARCSPSVIRCSRSIDSARPKSGCSSSRQAQRRVARVPVGVVELTRNFRSQRSIVDWVNPSSRTCCRAESDATTAKQALRSAYADASTGDDVAPSLDLCADANDEADVVVARIREALAAGLGSIAVLVRARSHAQALLPALRARPASNSAVELEGLFDRLATCDDACRSRARSRNPCDAPRVACRSCARRGAAFRWQICLAVAQRAVDRPIPDALADPDARNALGDDGRTRIERLWTALAPALAARGHQPFALRRARHGWHCAARVAASALDRRRGSRVRAPRRPGARRRLLYYDRVTALAERLFAEASDGPSTKVQLMTLHRARACVRCGDPAGADLETGGSGQPVLRWKVREHDGATSLVLAPMRAKSRHASGA